MEKTLPTPTALIEFVRVFLFTIETGKLLAEESYREDLSSKCIDHVMKAIRNEYAVREDEAIKFDQHLRETLRFSPPELIASKITNASRVLWLSILEKSLDE